MRKVVVTALFGGHDYPKDPIEYNPEWEYIMFTDDETIESDFWDIRLIMGDRGTARDIKIRTYNYLKYDVRLWIDASIVLKADPETILAELDDADMLFKVHPERETIFQELKACIKFGRMPANVAKVCEDRYIQLGYTEAEQKNTVIFETGMNMMRNTSSNYEFCELWYKETFVNFMRDQVGLPYVMWKLKPKYHVFTDGEFYAWANISKHSPELYLPEVRYTVPYAIDGNLGAAYNNAARGLDEDDYVCIMDGDIMFLDSKLPLWIAKTIADNQDYDVFTCMTNRLQDTQQLVKGVYDQSDIVLHKKVCIMQWKKFGTKVIPTEKPTAGLLMIMKARVLWSVKFKNGLMYLDTDFYYRAVDAGYKFGIMQGIYVLHYYRMAEGRNNILHLQRLKYE